MAWIAVSAGSAGAASAVAASEGTAPSAPAPPDLAAFSTAGLGTPPAPWKFVTLPHKTPTTFRVVELEGRHVLEVRADDAYGDLVHPIRLQPDAQTTLSWRWRVDRLLPDADLTSRSGDDAPARVCVFFAFDAARLSFGERTKLALARSMTGQDVPAETLCYVWDGKLPVDTALPNAFTQRERMIVLQSGGAKRGQWATERRSIQADYQRVFGDESGGRTPAITGIAVSGDSDNTQGHALAYVGDLSLEP